MFCAPCRSMAIPRHRTLIHRRVKQVHSVARYTSLFSNHRVHDMLQHRADFFLISGEVPNNGGNRSPIPQTQCHPTVCPGCNDQRTPPSLSAAGSHKMLSRFVTATNASRGEVYSIVCLRIISPDILIPSWEGRRVSGGVGTRRSSPQPGPRQPRQRLRNQPHRLFNICVGGAKAEAEANRGFSFITTQTDSPQNMRRFGDTRGAGGTCRCREVWL